MSIFSASIDDLVELLSDLLDTQKLLFFDWQDNRFVCKFDFCEMSNVVKVGTR